MPRARRREAVIESTAYATSPASALPASSVTAPSSPGGGIEQDEPGRLISFAAPPPVLAIWHWALDLVRRVAGQQEPAWRCVEFLAAEFLSGTPDTAGNPLNVSPGTVHDPTDSPRERRADEHDPDE